jgi:regulator of protease activity HflC (stomatin/prohibitin superfamily)
MKRTMMIRRSLLVLSCVILIQGCGKTVTPGERGLHWRPYTVGLDKNPLKAGFHFKAPWNNVFVYNVKWQSFTEKVDALSADDLPVSFQAALTLRPLAEEVYLLAEEVGPNWYREIVRPQFLAAVRSVVANYPMVVIPERSTEIGNKIEAVMVESLKGRHLDVYSVALAEIEFSNKVLKAIEEKQAKEQEKEQKEFEVAIAKRDADIARIRAQGEGDALKFRADGEAESIRIRARGQAEAQEMLAKTLTPEYLRLRLYDSPNSKMVLLPENSNVPMVLNPGGLDQSQPLAQGGSERR